MTLADLWEQSYALQNSWLDGRSRAQLTQLLSELNRINADDSDCRLLRAYLAYHFPCDITEHIDIEADLLAVLYAQKTNTTARLYLAHYYYDHGQYEAASQQLEEVNSAEYARVGQTWRSLKITEMKLSTKLYQRPIGVSYDDLVSFLERLQGVRSEDAAVPLELVTALMINRVELEDEWGREAIQRLGIRLRGLIDEIAGSHILQQELGTLVG
jgi:hypothetical protein